MLRRCAHLRRDCCRRLGHGVAGIGAELADLAAQRAISAARSAAAGAAGAGPVADPPAPPRMPRIMSSIDSGQASPRAPAGHPARVRISHQQDDSQHAQPGPDPLIEAAFHHRELPGRRLMAPAAPAEIAAAGYRMNLMIS